MKKSQYIKQRRIQQRNLERVMCKNMIWHIIIITIIMIITLCNMPRVAIAEKENKLSPSSINKSNYTSNNSKRMNNSNINVTASKAHDTLEQELLGWYDND